MGFTKNLCKLIEKEDISSYKLAKGIGVRITTITNWKNGTEPSIENLKLVADYFNVTVDELLKE